VARAVGEGFDCFLFGLALLAFGGCSPQNLAAAKGEQDIPVHRILTGEELYGDGVESVERTGSAHADLVKAALDLISRKFREWRTSIPQPVERCWRRGGSTMYPARSSFRSSARAAMSLIRH